VRSAVLAAAVAGVALLSSPAAGSPSSSELVWAANGVFTASADGSGARQLVPPLADQHSGPAWSPDGRTLVFSGRRSDQTDLYLVRSPASARVLPLRGRRVAPRRGRMFSYLLDPSWAPDGRRLAVTDAWTPAESTVRIVSLDTRRLRSLTAPRRGRADSSPAWSPGGETIAFTRRQAPGWVPSVMLAGSDGRGPRRLARGTSPSWSPDGRRLVLAWGNSIHRVDADGGSRIRLASGLGARGDALRPRWSPDGRAILYLSPRGIWTMNADGTDRRRVVSAAFVDGAGWRPR
jgi:TolB protein